MYSIAVARHAVTQSSKGQRSRSHGYENRHGRTVASVHGRYSAHIYAVVLPAAVAGVSLHVDTTACFLVSLQTLCHVRRDIFLSSIQLTPKAEIFKNHFCEPHSNFIIFPSSGNVAFGSHYKNSHYLSYNEMFDFSILILAVSLTERNMLHAKWGIFKSCGLQKISLIVWGDFWVANGFVYYSTISLRRRIVDAGGDRWSCLQAQDWLDLIRLKF